MTFLANQPFLSTKLYKIPKNIYRNTVFPFFFFWNKYIQEFWSCAINGKNCVLWNTYFIHGNHLGDRVLKEKAFYSEMIWESKNKWNSVHCLDWVKLQWLGCSGASEHKLSVICDEGKNGKTIKWSWSCWGYYGALRNHPLKHDILKHHRIPHCMDNFYPS